MFEATGDMRNTLYARLGGIRAGADPTPLPKLSYMLDQEHTSNPLLQSDKELRMFCLIVKGDFDGESDTLAMRRDWMEVASLVQALGNTKWQYRAQGQLGFADFYDGDLPGAQRNVAQALIGATKTGDIGGEIFYLSATATVVVPVFLFQAEIIPSSVEKINKLIPLFGIVKSEVLLKITPVGEEPCGLAPRGMFTGASNCLPVLSYITEVPE